MRAARAARKISPTPLPRLILLSHHRRDSISSRALAGPPLVENDIKPAPAAVDPLARGYFCPSQKHANFARRRFTRQRIFVRNFRALTWKPEDGITEP